MNLELSIVIVSWNTRELLKGCLESVFANLGNLSAEVFVVDNASTDGSAKMVRSSFPQVRLIENSSNRGFGPANNQAIRESAGRYVLMLNSDTLVLGSVLGSSVEYMEEHSAVGVFGCRVLNGDGTVQLTCLRYPSLLNVALSAAGVSMLKWPRFCGREHLLEWQRDSERDVEVVSGCYMLLRRSAIDQVGLLDEEFFFCGEESDWCRRFKKAGWGLRFAPVGEIVHFGNASGGQLGARRDLMLTEGMIRFLRKHDGAAVAAIAWLLLLVFSATHYVGWAVAALCIRRGSAALRRDHFLSVVRNFHQAWPCPTGGAQ